MKRTPHHITLLLADVDGTLVTHEKVLTDRAKKAVADLRGAGIRFAITSGRPPKGMEMVIEPLAIDTPIAGFNGGLFTDASLTTVKEQKIPADIARDVVKMIADEGLDVWLYAGNDWLVHKVDAPHVAREQKTVQFPPKVVADFSARLGDAVKIVGVSDDHDAIQRCAKDVHEAFGDKVTAALSQPYYLDVTHPAANKGAVVEELAKKYGIPTSEIATIGDMPNDVTMFKKSGFAIAMGNADDEVKGEADAVTADCDSEGFAEAVEKYFLSGSERSRVMSTPTIEIRPDAASLAESVAEFIIERIEDSNGPFALNLSGGSTPKRLYEVLGSEINRRKIDWTRVHIFIGDERFVPKDHPDSNYGMILKSLVSHVPIPEENVHAVETDLATPEAAAAAYERTLKTFLGKETLDLARPIFAVTLLGLGDDGHTASLFPGTAALRERTKWVTAVVGAKPEPRISMTFPVLASSRAVVFLVAGEGKRAMLKRLIERDPEIPASHVEAQGELYVFCDEAAFGDPALMSGG